MNLNSNIMKSLVYFIATLVASTRLRSQPNGVSMGPASGPGTGPSLVNPQTVAVLRQRPVSDLTKLSSRFLGANGHEHLDYGVGWLKSLEYLQERINNGLDLDETKAILISHYKGSASYQARAGDRSYHIKDSALGQYESAQKKLDVGMLNNTTAFPTANECSPHLAAFQAWMVKYRHFIDTTFALDFVKDTQTVQGGKQSLTDKLYKGTQPYNQIERVVVELKQRYNDSAVTILQKMIEFGKMNASVSEPLVDTVACLSKQGLPNLVSGELRSLYLSKNEIRRQIMTLWGKELKGQKGIELKKTLLALPIRMPCLMDLISSIKIL